MRHALLGLSVIASFLLAPLPARAQLDDGGVVVNGQITEVAARGRRLFEAGRFGEAAVVLNRVASGETGDAVRDRQVAQYQLAIALYRTRLYHASVAQFYAITEQPSHSKFDEALPWLAKLATELPEPSDVIERIGKYDSRRLERLNNPEQRDLYWQLNYLLGRYKYRNRIYDDAIRLFGNIDVKSKHYVEAQLFIGTSYVQLRKAARAASAFERAARAVDESPQSAEDKARLKNLAFMLMARTYYSSSVRLGDRGAPRINVKKRFLRRSW